MSPLTKHTAFHDVTTIWSGLKQIGLGTQSMLQPNLIVALLWVQRARSTLHLWGWYLSWLNALDCLWDWQSVRRHQIDKRSHIEGRLPLVLVNDFQTSPNYKPQPPTISYNYSWEPLDNMETVSSGAFAINAFTFMIANIPACQLAEPLVKREYPTLPPYPAIVRHLAGGFVHEF